MQFIIISVVLATLPPEIIEYPKDVKGKLYEKAILYCKAAGSPQPQILWYKNGKLFRNDNNDQSQLVFENLKLQNRGFYYCEARNTINGQNISVTTEKTPVIVTIEGISDTSIKACHMNKIVTHRCFSISSCC